jgi:hypothetical protein
MITQLNATSVVKTCLKRTTKSGTVARMATGALTPLLNGVQKATSDTRLRQFSRTLTVKHVVLLLQKKRMLKLLKNSKILFVRIDKVLPLIMS